MRCQFESREAAARRFNADIPGGHWTPRDMALHDVFLTGWPEGALPERCWLPLRDIKPIEAAAVEQQVDPRTVVAVERLSAVEEAEVEQTIEAIDWRCYGPEG